MPKLLYALAQSQTIVEEPFSMLSQEQWLQVIRYSYNKEIEDPSKKGHMLSLLKENTERMLLVDTARNYVKENKKEQEIIPEELCKKLESLLQVIMKDYAWRNISYNPGKVSWDMYPRSMSHSIL